MVETKMPDDLADVEKRILARLDRLKQLTTRENHDHLKHNRKEINNSDYCMCCYCLDFIDPKEIVKWIDGDTAICPKCGVDAVLGSSCGFDLTTELLEKMRKEWF